jgi:diguanylate cyclase (GGDEF)-like protein
MILSRSSFLHYPIPLQLQSSYAEHLSGERIHSVREGCIVALLLFAAFGILDIWAIPSALSSVWLIRGFIVLILLGLYWSTRFPFFLKRYVPLVISTYLLLGFSIEAMIFLAGMNDLARHHYYITLILVVMALYTWSFLSLRLTMTTGIILVASYIAEALLFQHLNNAQEWPVLLSNLFFLMGANIIGIYSNIKRNRYMHESFLLQQKLQAELERSEEEKRNSHFHSEHDALTGLPNRKKLMRELKHTLDEAMISHNKVALLFIDLDGFKPINDEHGHATGDQVLTIIGQRLTRCVREEDIMARIGGDEFVVALTLDGKDPYREESRRIAQSILTSFERNIRQPDIHLPLSASIGIAFYPEHAKDAEELLAAADLQMYAAKRQGKGMISMAPK